MVQSYSKEEFKFCRKALMNLWRARGIVECSEAKVALAKTRALFKEINS